MNFRRPASFLAAVFAFALAACDAPAPAASGRVVMRNTEPPARVGDCDKHEDQSGGACTVTVSVTVAAKDGYPCYIHDLAPKVLVTSQGSGNRDLRWVIGTPDSANAQFRFGKFDDKLPGLQVVDHATGDKAFDFAEDQEIDSAGPNPKPRKLKIRANHKHSGAAWVYQYTVNVLYRPSAGAEWKACQPFDPIIVNRG